MTQAGGGGRQPIAASAGRVLPAAQPKAVGVSDNPMVVHVRDAALQNLPSGGASPVGYDIWDLVVVAPGRTVIAGAAGTIVVPAQQALDISSLAFVVLADLGGGALAPLGDYFHALNVLFLIEINGRSPWDVYTRYAPAMATPMRPGWSTLNQDMMASWVDAPMHLVVGPNQQITFSYDKLGVMNLVGAADLIGVRIRGRWLPEKRWKELRSLNGEA